MVQVVLGKWVRLLCQNICRPRQDKGCHIVVLRVSPGVVAGWVSEVDQWKWLIGLGETRFRWWPRGIWWLTPDHANGFARSRMITGTTGVVLGYRISKKAMEQQWH